MSAARPSLHELEPLVIAATGGDRDAFGQLVGATSGVVSSITLAILGDIEASRDAAQDVFLAAWRDLRKLRNPASFLPWLRQLARNRAHHVLRSHVRGKARAEGLTDEFLESIADPTPDAGSSLVKREDLAALAEAFAALPDDTREVLTLFYREGQSIAQVAELLDLTDAAVRKRLSRAREALRGAMLVGLGETLRRTAPGAAFTATVLGALTVSAPATASAATLAATKGAAKAGLSAKLLFLGSGAILGSVGGVAGVVLGSRHLLREARTEQERRGILRYQLLGSLAVIVASFGMSVGWQLTGWRPWPALDFAAFIIALALLKTRVLGRAIQPRLDAEMREDPNRATARRRHERRVAILGWSLGLTFGSMGVLLGMWFTR